jgi:hypothetical protein
VDQQHPPASGTPGQVASSVQHLAQVHRELAAPSRRARQQQLDPRSLLARQIRRVAFSLTGSLAIRPRVARVDIPSLNHPARALPSYSQTGTKRPRQLTVVIWP